MSLIGTGMRCYTFDTAIEPDEVIRLFRKRINLGAGGFIGLGNKLLYKWDFYSPALKAYPDEDVPAPSAADGAVYKMGSVSLDSSVKDWETAVRVSGGSDVAGAMQLEIWSIGEKNWVMLTQGGNTSGAAGSLIKKIIKDWQAADPSISVKKTKSRAWFNSLD